MIIESGSDQQKNELRKGEAHPIRGVICLTCFTILAISPYSNSPSL